MFNDIVWLSGNELHLKEPEHRVDLVKLIHDRCYSFVFLRRVRLSRTLRQLTTYIQNELPDNMLIW